MEHHQVLPDVINTLPKEELSVSYGSNGVKLGNVLTPTQVQNPPTVTWAADPNKVYVLCMIGR
jgi:hypothetical protein